MPPHIEPTDDFWSRDNNRQNYHYALSACGTAVLVTANQPEILAAARLSAERFSRAAPDGDAPIRLRLVVADLTTKPVPEALPDLLKYQGTERWISMTAGEWGYAFGNLETREAVIFLSAALAGQTRLISRYFIDHYLLNFLFSHWAMLHASAIVRADGALIALAGDHNVGKSTTALRMLQAGHKFLADGMTLFRVCDGELRVAGYPIGEVKLRDDVLHLLAASGGERVQVREHQKTVIDLTAAFPGQLVTEVFTPGAVRLCFVERGGAGDSVVRAVGADDARQLLARHTLFWDTSPHLESNTRTLNFMLDHAATFRVAIGSDVNALLARLEKLP